MKSSDIKKLFPGVFQQAAEDPSLLSSMWEVMEGMHAPSERALDHLDATFNPNRTSDIFVPVLARWLDLDWVFDGGAHWQQSSVGSSELIPTGLGRVRALIAMAASLSQWRGTRKGLILFLETATGVRGFTIQEQVMGAQGVPRPFHLHVYAPSAARDYLALVTRIIEAEKPAYVTYDLEIQSAEPEEPDG